MVKISEQEILNLPITTNKIYLSFDKQCFFAKYAIVSYYSIDQSLKNLAYEQLSEESFISVAGLRARWAGAQSKNVRFFILFNKEKTDAILNSLRKYDNIRFKIDALQEYDSKLQERILASLAINSLGKRKPDRMMYNDGTLLLCDDKNFLVPKSRKELVCLKIEVNEYMNLTAKTTSFSNPRDVKQLFNHSNCVFQTSKDVYGQWWSGVAVKPVIVGKLNTKNLDLTQYYIQKKRFADKHNIVPYWPYNPENYTHGKLFALAQVVDGVNASFKSMLSIDFCDFPVYYYDAFRSEKETMALLQDYLKGKAIYFEDPFKTNGSKTYINQIKEAIVSVVGNILDFPKSATSIGMLIKLCEPKEKEQQQTFYSQSLNRMANSNIPVQHVVFDSENIKEEFSDTEARRILLELVVKDSLQNLKMPNVMAESFNDWEFARYKINNGNVLGAILTLSDDGRMHIKDFGFSYDEVPTVFEDFARNYLSYDNSFKIKGAKDYMVLKKDGNIFLIVDTDEIPILDVSEIDEAYGKILAETEPLAMFKRKQVAHKYLRGYIGLHVWLSDGIDGEENGAYSYIAGFNSENLKIMKGTKMDRMPRVRKIFILHHDNKEKVKEYISEIFQMLKFGFGRWNEIMTYPIPFKFLQEYLDDLSETAYSKHWSEIGYKDNL